MPDSSGYEDTDDEMKAEASRSPPSVDAHLNKIKEEAPRSPSPEKFDLKKVKVEVPPSLPPLKTSLKKKKQDQVNEDLLKYFDHMDEYYVWQSKTNKQQEAEIYERRERYEDKLNRQRILEELEKKKVHKRVRAVSSDDEDEKPTRKVYRTRNKKRQASQLGVTDIFGSTLSSSDDSSSEEHSCKEEALPSEREPGQISFSEDEVRERPLIKNEDQLKEAMMTRSQLAKIVHAPFFIEVVTGSYVIIRVGKMKNLPSTIIGEVVKVMRSAKVYNLENTKTDKTLTVRFGNFEGNFRLLFVSGSLKLETGLFEEYMKRSYKMQSVPSLETIAAKKKQIYEAMTHRYTNQEINKMMEEKKRFNQPNKTRGARKSELLNRLRYAKENRADDEVRRLELELNKLDETENWDGSGRKEVRSELLETIKSRREMGYGVESRHVNFTTHKMPNISNIDDDDPFTRKKLRGRVVTGSRSRSDVTDENTSPIEEIGGKEIEKRSVTTTKFDYFKIYKEISFNFDFPSHSS